MRAAQSMLEYTLLLAVLVSIMIYMFWTHPQSISKAVVDMNNATGKALANEMHHITYNMFNLEGDETPK